MLDFFLENHMENQINVGDQNTQQIGQSPINQPVQFPEKPKVNYQIVLKKVLLVMLFLTVIGVISLWGYRELKNRTSDVSVTIDVMNDKRVEVVRFRNKILSKGRQQIGKNQEWYWTNADGSSMEPLNLEIQVDEEKRLVRSVTVSPDHTKLLVTVGDKREFDEMNKLTTLYLTGTPVPIAEWNFKYDFFVTSLDGKIISQVNPKNVLERIGEFKNVIFGGWMTNNSLYFEAKDAFVVQSEAPPQRVVLGEYNLTTGIAQVLIDRQARGLRGAYLSENGQWLLYVKDYGLLASEKFMKNLQTQEEQTINTSGYLFSEGEYLVAFPSAGVNFQHNFNEEQNFVISHISDLQAQIGLVQLAEPRRYFVYGYKSLSWSNDYSLLAIIAEYDRSGYGIEYKEPQLHVYDRKGNLKCMWELNDSDLTTNSIHTENYSEKIFSGDNRYLMLVSRPNADYLGTIYWRTFDLTDCSLSTPKMKMDRQLTPVAWF